jgi:hypothetical protein
MPEDPCQLAFYKNNSAAPTPMPAAKYIAKVIARSISNQAHRKFLFIDVAVSNHRIRL